MRILYVDIESYGEVPISAGTARYWESAEVMTVQWAR